MSCCGDHPSMEEIDEVSRLVAQKLSAFMKTLRDSGFAVGLAQRALPVLLHRRIPEVEQREVAVAPQLGQGRVVTVLRGRQPQDVLEHLHDLGAVDPISA